MNTDSNVVQGQQAQGQMAQAQTQAQVAQAAGADPVVDHVADPVRGNANSAGVALEDDVQLEETIAEEGVINVNDDGNIEAFSMDDLNMDSLDDFDGVIEEDTGVVEASEDLSLAGGNYIWYVGEALPSTFKWITKMVGDKVVPVKLYSAGVIIKVVFDIANQTPINESFIQNFYFYGKDGKPNRMGLAQAKNFSTSVLSAYENTTREEVQQMLVEEKVGNFRLFRELLPCEEDDIKYVSSKVRRREGKGDYKGTFNNDIPTGKIKEAQALYESLTS